MAYMSASSIVERRPRLNRSNSYSTKPLRGQKFQFKRLATVAKRLLPDGLAMPAKGRANALRLPWFVRLCIRGQNGPASGREMLTCGLLGRALAAMKSYLVVLVNNYPR